MNKEKRRWRFYQWCLETFLTWLNFKAGNQSHEVIYVSSKETLMMWLQYPRFSGGQIYFGENSSSIRTTVWCLNDFYGRLTWLLSEGIRKCLIERKMIWKIFPQTITAFRKVFLLSPLCCVDVFCFFCFIKRTCGKNVIKEVSKQTSLGKLLLWISLLNNYF